MSTLLIVVVLAFLGSINAQFSCPAPWVENPTLDGHRFVLGAWRSLSVAISFDIQWHHATACLVDTGAEVTFISDRVALHYPNHFMCHNKLLQGIFGVGAEVIGYLNVCFTTLYITGDVHSSAVVLVPPFADTVFTSRHKCIIGFSTLEATHAEINFRCGHISFVKGNHSEETFREDVVASMIGLGINMDSLIPYNLLNPNISENAEKMMASNEGKFILFSSISNLGRISTGVQLQRR